ncbi:uncharacterized protein LOC143068793 isoform X1 [Mytilus galloprovincialis]|uniref:uncharacterized protein LOC143068793 isoform X1 n=1 Tax=Mytilus galloprovincialis TaxID=29158 RepID=UPI003F7B729E
MWKLFYLFVFVFICGLVHGNVYHTTVQIARCRVQCLKQTIKHRDISTKINDGNCFKKFNCDGCWQMCSYLYASYQLTSTVCSNPEVCHKGCKVACRFRENEPTGNVTAGWKFKGKDAHVQRLKHSHQVEITWSRPELELPSTKNDLIVYVIMFRDKTVKIKDWEEVQQTSSQEVLLEQDSLPILPEFWLMAVSENGTIAEIKFDMDSSPIVQVITPAVVFPLKIKQPVQISSDSPLTVNVTLQEDTKTGILSALVEWDHPPIFTSKRVILYDIHLLFTDCNNVYETSPTCLKTPEQYAHTVGFRDTLKPHYKLDKLLYNSYYHLEVQMNDDWYGNVEFRTVECPNVDTKTYTVCPSVITANNNESETEEDYEHEPIDIMEWGIVLRNWKCNKHTGTVSVLLAWNVPFNHSAVSSYTISCIINDVSDIPAIVRKTNKTEEWFDLDENTEYRIEGVAIYQRNGRRDAIQSDIRRLNTTMCAIKAESVKSRKVTDADWKNIDKIIVGITCVASVILLGLIILFIYKKRHTFKDIIITKPAVAKSNSYKSNVGCKVDYSNQLLVMSDEWELDPCRLKFCTPIGQGAFGKVVTGYYDNKRVAIKLVRDSAPLSYKEDLLAEINLMKRIGAHPNIVSMLGACTLSEPIALAMEYIPFGNLQMFLKKCRMEGDFTKRVGHPTEVTYSIMDPNGDIDNGVITPADMLSFARQVAMAMQYLAEKKYVHRDLAARNVLLDYDKVVKVCDFGLSRDIFNDNQYHKVTSGKLPLKWMAIESLRDRVFTTQSDVWSFGILLYEIVTMGGSPYPHTALADLYYVLANGYRMEKPGNSSDELYAIMRQCWLENPKDRPLFCELRLQLEQLLSVDRNYLDLDNIDVPLSTSESSSNSVPKTDDRLSLISNRHSQSVKNTGMVKSSTGRQPRAITIPSLTRDTITVSICGEQSNDWLTRARDDETTT